MVRCELALSKAMLTIPSRPLFYVPRNALQTHFCGLLPFALKFFLLHLKRKPIRKASPYLGWCLLRGCGSQPGQSSSHSHQGKIQIRFYFSILCHMCPARVKILCVPAMIAEGLSPNLVSVLRRIDLDQMACDRGICLLPNSATMCAPADELACAQGRRVQQRECGSLA